MAIQKTRTTGRAANRARPAFVEDGAAAARGITAFRRGIRAATPEDD